MVRFEAFQPVAFFGARVCFRHPCAVICKREKIAFSCKANRADWSNQVIVYELVWAFRSTLRLAIIDFGRFGTLTAVTNVPI